MGKTYKRKSKRLGEGGGNEYTCLKCGYQTTEKLKLKSHNCKCKK